MQQRRYTKFNVIITSTQKKKKRTLSIAIVNPPKLMIISPEIKLNHYQNQTPQKTAGGMPRMKI